MIDGARSGSVLLTDRYWWSPEWFCLAEYIGGTRSGFALLKSFLEGCPARYARTFLRTQRGSIGGVRSDLALIIFFLEPSVVLLRTRRGSKLTRPVVVLSYLVKH